MTKLDTGKRPTPHSARRHGARQGLDELPQLLNVLRGERSIVGARPCIPYEYELCEPS